MGWWLALEGGYGTRLVEDDARHSRQHLDETTDRRASRSESVAAQEIITFGFRLPTLGVHRWQVSLRLQEYGRKTQHTLPSYRKGTR